MNREKLLKYVRWADFGAHQFSKCGKRKYFAIVLAPSGRVVGTGYNGSPPGMPECEDGYCPRLHDDTPSGASYENCISTHAEISALTHSNWSDREHGILVVNGPPCFNCGKVVAGSGVSEVACVLDPLYLDWHRSRKFMEEAGLKITTFTKEEIAWETTT